MTTMRHNDYIARIDYDDELEMFHGRIINLRDVVNFYGRSIDELKQEFENSINTYLAVCRERNKSPEKPFSGRFNIRMTPDQHRRLAEAAEAHGMSLNTWAIKQLEHAAEQ